MYVQRSVFSLAGPHVVHHDLLGLAGVQGEVVPGAWWGRLQTHHHVCGVDEEEE